MNIKEFLEQNGFEINGSTIITEDNYKIVVERNHDWTKIRFNSNRGKTNWMSNHKTILKHIQYEINKRNKIKEKVKILEEIKNKIQHIATKYKFNTRRAMSNCVMIEKPAGATIKIDHNKDIEIIIHTKCIKDIQDVLNLVNDIRQEIGHE